MIALRLKRNCAVLSLLVYCLLTPPPVKGKGKGEVAEEKRGREREKNRENKDKERRIEVGKRA
jgi:hypothetical protein